MLDPLTALTLASSIVQFVDFGSKLVVTGYRSYKAFGQSFDQEIELDTITSSFNDLLDRLRSSADAAHPFQQSREDAALQRLATACQQTARELLDILEALKNKKPTSIKSWQTVQWLVAEIRSANNIKSLRKRLDSIKLEVNGCLLNILKYANHCQLAVTLREHTLLISIAATASLP